MISLKLYGHYSNVPINNVYVEKFNANIVNIANVTRVTFTKDVRNNKTVGFEKCDLVLPQNR